MASLLEQYEQATSSSVGTLPRDISLDRGSGKKSSPASGSTYNAKNLFASAAAGSLEENELPIFSKQRIEFQIPNGKTIYRMAACDRLIILATKDNTLLRMDLKNGAEQFDVLEAKTSSAGDSVDDIFLDPAGRHILLAMLSGDVFYFSRTSRKARVINKLRTHILTAVGWNYQILDWTSSVSSSGPSPVLLGTAQGVIFETEFNAHAADSTTVFHTSSIEAYWKQVCNLAQPEPVLIKGIFCDRLRRGEKGAWLYVVLIATQTRLYQFKGSIGQSVEPPLFHEIFLLDPEKPMTNFLELPGNPRHCCLSTWRPANVQSSSHQLFSSFAWLTEPGIYYAEIGEGLGDDSSLLRNPQLYTFPKEKDKANRPISLVSTEFHVLIQYLNYVRVLSKLAGAIVFEDPFGERYGRVMGMCRDPVAGTVWVYSEAAVYRYKITDESRRNWRIFLAKGDYDAALRYCENDPVVTNLVRVLKAEDLLKKGEYEKSAAIYASTDVAFEEVALKFSRLRQEKALKLLITKKADSLSSVKDAPQLFMVCSWLMEIYLNSLGLLKNNEKDQEAYNGLLVEFRSFLLKPQFMDIFRSSPDVFYGLLLSHGADDEYVHFATQLGDTRRLVEFQLERDNYREALRVLATQTQGPSGTEMIYEFSPPLMRHVPKLVVDVWISKGHQLNPHRFLPSLQRYNGPGMETEAGEIIRYLEHCIHVLGSTDNALHNYLVALYCRTNNEDALLAYLITADEESSRRSVELYDRKGSLRLCVENDLHRAAVHLYCALNLHVEAVELALKIDPLLAKQIAKSVTLEEDIRKRLWLLIAQHLVAQDSDISKATELLQESSGVVKIEDILPFFPDFVTIDDFKEAICASLENYNHHIGSLKSEVDDATKEAEELRSEILDYRAQCLFVNAGDQCFVCKMPLLTHQFFLFPCRHHVHWDCLLNVVRPHLAGAKQLLLEELQKQLETLKEHDDTGSLHSFASGGPGGGATISRRDMVKLELEDIVAAECPFCGLLMIKSIDLPFIAAEEYESVAASWL